MKTVYLLRHAKSDWSVPGRSDFDRPLNERGREAAAKMAAFLKAEGICPDLVLVSTARRTQESWALIQAAFFPPPPTEKRVSLYLASAETLLSALKSLDEPHSSVMIIGHNPGLEELAARLTAPDQEGEAAAAQQAMQRKYPTGALAEIRLPADTWAGLIPGSGALIRFKTPKSL